MRYSSGPIAADILEKAYDKALHGIDVFAVTFKDRSGDRIDRMVDWCEDRLGLSWKTNDKWYKIDHWFYFTEISDAKDFYSTWKSS